MGFNLRFMDSNLIHMIKGQELNDDPAVPNLLMTIVLTTWIYLCSIISFSTNNTNNSSFAYCIKSLFSHYRRHKNKLSSPVSHHCHSYTNAQCSCSISMFYCMTNEGNQKSSHQPSLIPLLFLGFHLHVGSCILLAVWPHMTERI